jgi:dTDP-4-amino-4,6-dideoxygalactose transaminase
MTSTSIPKAEPDVNTVSMSAHSEDVALEPAFFYRSAREGMGDFLAAVKGQHSLSVLLPAFIGWSPREGSGVFDPVRAMGAVPGFYDLNADLTVDLVDLESQLAKGDYQVLVVIHYFGRTEPELKRIRDLADRYQVLLVEDLAHGFFSSARGDAGNYGDVRLYSLHKMFPFKEGGMVQYANRKLVRGQASTSPGYASLLMSYNWKRISQTRRSNFTTLTDLLSGASGCGTHFQLLWPTLSDGDVPQTLPVKIIGSHRDDLYHRMNANGFGMVSLYHTLIPDVRDGFTSLNSLSKHIINFPVHQDVTPNDLAPMVDAFIRHLGHHPAIPIETDLAV